MSNITIGLMNNARDVGCLRAHGDYDDRQYTLKATADGRGVVETRM